MACVEQDTWSVADDRRAERRGRHDWPRNAFGFLAASALLHVAALAVVIHPAMRSTRWQLRLPTGRNSVALAASVSSPRTEAETQICIEPLPPAAAEEPVSRREAELPAPATARFASARADRRLPLPTDVARRTNVEQNRPHDRPQFTPPKKTADAKLRPRETATLRQSVASAPSAASSGVRDSKAPQAVLSVKPVYPSEALAAGIEGVVKIRVRVDATGKVVEAAVYESSGHAVLDRAALNVIFRWRFSPPDGEQGVAAEFVHPFEFDDQTVRR